MGEIWLGTMRATGGFLCRRVLPPDGGAGTGGTRNRLKEGNQYIIGGSWRCRRTALPRPIALRGVLSLEKSGRVDLFQMACPSPKRAGSDN